jgi:hypothetical protein
MHTIQKWSVFHGLFPSQYFARFIDKDNDMRRIPQRTQIVPGTVPDEIDTWTGNDIGPCSNSEATVLSVIAMCVPGADPAKCFAKPKLGFCQNVNTIAVAKSCSLKNLTSVFPDQIGQCQAVTNNPNPETSRLEAALHVIDVPALGPNIGDAASAASALEQMASIAQHKESWTSLSLVFDNVNKLSASGRGRKGLTYSSVKPLQGKINDAVRAAPVRSAEAAESVDVAGKEIDWKVVPNPNSGTTGKTKITGPVRWDCSVWPCTDGWLMVEAQTSRGPLKGWIQPGDLTPPCSISLTYLPSRSTPDAESMKRLREFMRWPRSFERNLRVDKWSLGRG